ATMPDRPLRADARRNRDKVLHAAREAFAESGYGVPLDEIAGRAGVGPGTVYRHFPAKEALFQAVITARVEDLIGDAPARAGATGCSPSSRTGCGGHRNGRRAPAPPGPGRLPCPRPAPPRLSPSVPG